MEFIKKISSKRGRDIGLFKCGCTNEFKKYIDDARLQCVQCDIKSPIKKQRKPYTKSKKPQEPLISKPQIKESKIDPIERLSHVYHFMMKRCYDETDKQYPEYGSRGITVCNEWKESEFVFITWCCANGFKTHLTLDRENNDKGYSPDNCRFVSMNVQNANQRLIKANNKSGYKGVSWHNKSQSWIVSITWLGKNVYLGIYDDPREAAQVRDDYIDKYNLPHAKNFVTKN